MKRGKQSMNEKNKMVSESESGSEYKVENENEINKLLGKKKTEKIKKEK
jgi:hypothetical protein